MKVLMFSVLAVIALGAHGMVMQNSPNTGVPGGPGSLTSGAVPAAGMGGMMSNQGNPQNNGLVNQMMSSNQIYSGMSQSNPNLFTSGMGNYNMMPNHQMTSQSHNMFNGPYMHNGNNQQGNQQEQSSMSFLPFMFGAGDQMRRLFAMKMMMDPRQKNVNRMLPFAMMDGMGGDAMLPMMMLGGLGGGMNGNGRNNGGNQRAAMDPLMMTLAMSGMM